MTAEIDFAPAPGADPGEGGGGGEMGVDGSDESSRRWYHTEPHRDAASGRTDAVVVIAGAGLAGLAITAAIVVTGYFHAVVGLPVSLVTWLVAQVDVDQAESPDGAVRGAVSLFVVAIPVFLLIVAGEGQLGVSLAIAALGWYVWTAASGWSHPRSDPVAWDVRADGAPGRPVRNASSGGRGQADG